MKTKTRQSVVKRLCTILPLCLFTFLSLHAQTYTQRIQQSRQGEGTVTIHQDAAIDKLVNGEPATTPRPTPPAAPKPKQENKPAKPQTDTTQKHPTQTVVQNTDSTNLSPSGKRLYKTTGYRVQVFAGGNTRADRQKAEQTGRALEMLFPGETVYVHFYSPRWICRIGNYLTYEEAKERMQEIRKLGYSAATIVKGKIIATQ